MEIKNLWKETLDCLKDNNKTWEDIKNICTHSFELVEGKWVNDHYQITKDNFEEVAKVTNYEDECSGTNYKLNSMVIYGDDFIMERYLNECGGRGWMFIKTKPTIPTKK